MNDWSFNDPPNVAVLTTVYVLEGEAILYISHDAEDGSWQFHTGEPISESDARVVSLKRIVQLDPSVVQLADLPLGGFASRSQIGADWQRFRA